MDRKKIVGFLLFITLISTYIAYPNIQEWNFERRIKAMIVSEQYEEIQDLMAEKGVEELSQELQLKLLKSKINSGRFDEYTLNTVVQLIDNNNLNELQNLVNELGMRLGHLLIFIEKVEGITIPENMMPELAEMLYQNRAVDRAIYRGYEVTEIDGPYIAYLSDNVDIETLLSIYDDIPLYLKETYYDAVGLHSISWNLVGLPPNQQIEYMDYLITLDFPESILRYVGMLMAERHPDNQLLQHPFLAENIYIDFFRSINLLKNPKTKDQGIAELNSPKFQEIKGIEQLMNLAQSGTRMHRIDFITNQGLMLYTRSEINPDTHTTSYGVNKTIYDIKKKTEVDVDNTLLFYDISPNRDYMIGMVYQNNTDIRGIYNNNLEKVTTFENDLIVSYWIDENSFVLRQHTSDGAYGEQEIFIVDESQPNSSTTGIYSGQKPYTLDFEPAVEGAKLWAINDERYISIEPKKFEHPEFNFPGVSKYYTVRDRKTHEVMKKVPFDYKFLGNCDEFIYGIIVEEEFIQILVKMDINTGEVTKLPFYSLQLSLVNNPNFIDIYELIEHESGDSSYMIKRNLYR